MEPIISQKFNYSRIVECGYCKGTGVLYFANVPAECGFCGGAGKLMDIREGTVSLFRINENNNQKKSEF